MSRVLPLATLVQRTAMAANAEAQRLRTLGQISEADRLDKLVAMLASFEPSSPADIQGEDRLLRLSEVCGDPRRGIPRMVPIDRETWRRGVKSGKYPQPIKFGSKNLWRLSDVKKLLEKISQGAA
ncbi:MAG TPA: hypothetical protein V6D19_06520 [Stenomitos sp.]